MQRLARYLQSKNSPYVPYITFAAALSPMVLCLTATVVLLIVSSKGSVSFTGIVCLLGALVLLFAVFPVAIMLLRLLNRPKSEPPP